MGPGARATAWRLAGMTAEKVAPLAAFVRPVHPDGSPGFCGADVSSGRVGGLAQGEAAAGFRRRVLADAELAELERIEFDHRHAVLDGVLGGQPAGRAGDHAGFAHARALRDSPPAAK